MSESKRNRGHSTHVPPEAPPRPDDLRLDKFAWRNMWLLDNNTLWTVVGDTGDGKSYASLVLGELIDPDFGIENVAFGIIEFIEKVVDDSYGRGSVIVLEEGSVEASSYDWHDESNRVFAKILDTWRHQNRMGIINLPNFQALEKGARRRTKAIVEMHQPYRPWKGYSQAKFKKAKYGNIEDNFTTPFPTIEGKERKWMRFGQPSEELQAAYEEKKENYTGDLNEELLESLLDSQEEQEAKDQTPKDIAQEIIESGDAEQYVKEYNGRKSINQELIEVDYDIGGRKGKKVKVTLEREILQ